MKKASVFFLFVFTVFQAVSQEWNVLKSPDYMRITEILTRDIDGDGVAEIICASFGMSGKTVDVYQIQNGSLVLYDRFVVPKKTVFFDAGDLDNDGAVDLVFLASDGLYFRAVTRNASAKTYQQIRQVYSEIVVPQPELLKNVPMIVDLDQDGKNELIIENITAVEIFETGSFTRLAAINLETVLEYSMVPGQFYPQYIFYTLPIILVDDLDGDKKKEIITKFPQSVNIYSQKSPKEWQLKRSINMAQDNVYFLSNSFVKFSFPVISDIDNDSMKEVVISSANMDMPKVRFEAIGDLYYFNTRHSRFELHKSKRIVVKGIPLNLPYFMNISDGKYKDFILPYIPFNLVSIFVLLSGNGDLNVPFVYFKQDQDRFDMSHGKKLFEIPFRIENIQSFVEELPFDAHTDREFPDFYYFVHHLKNKTADILQYTYKTDKQSYDKTVLSTLQIPYYTPELPAVLKLADFSQSKRKDVLFFYHRNFFILYKK